MPMINVMNVNILPEYSKQNNSERDDSTKFKIKSNIVSPNNSRMISTNETKKIRYEMVR